MDSQVELFGKIDAARHVSLMGYDPTTDKFLGSAFERKSGDSDGLSFTQMGLFSDIMEQDQNVIRMVVGSARQLKPSHRFAVVNVADVVKALRFFDDLFAFLHDPLPAIDTTLANPAHCLLKGLPFKGEVVGGLNSEAAGDLIARVVKYNFPAVTNE